MKPTDEMAEKINAAIKSGLENWFGEAIECMDNEHRVRKGLLEPLYKKVGAALTAALADVPDVGWKPMDTAPKDGTEVDL